MGLGCNGVCAVERAGGDAGGGKPVMEVRPLGEMPMSPLTMVRPVLVMALVATMPKPAAVPRLTWACPVAAGASPRVRTRTECMMLRLMGEGEAWSQIVCRRGSQCGS